MFVKGIFTHLLTFLLIVAIIVTVRSRAKLILSKTCSEVRCKSSSSKRTTCTVRNADKHVITHVRLKKQSAKSKCKGKYGTSNNTIWVEKGCQGIFKYCYVLGKVEQPVVKHCGNLNCSSLVFKAAVCKPPERRIIVSISLNKKTSISKCGGRYGLMNNSIWVNGGCRGVFRYCYVSGKPRFIVQKKNKKSGLKCGAVQCSSKKYKHTACPVPSNRLIKNVRLTKQKSSVICSKQAKTFGFKKNVVWADQGCSGLFKYCYVKIPAKKDWLICESKNSKYMSCPISWKVNRIVSIEKRSRAKCVKGVSYGLRRGTLWVNKGCSAKITFLREHKVPAKTDEIDCSSKDNVYVKCRIPKKRRITDVKIKRHYSTTNCELPTPKYGITRDNSIWVYQGCQARFSYGYKNRRA